jgi:hypothetical protein
MAIRHLIKESTYVGSVSLMTISRELRNLPGIEDAALIMGTEANKNDVRLLMGGTDLLVQMREGLMRPASLIDVKYLPGTTSIKYDPVSGLHRGGGQSESGGRPYRSGEALSAAV